MKKPFKKEVQPLAPNDPNRVPKEHRHFINDTFNILKKKGYSNFDSQVVLQCMDLSARGSDFVKILKTAVELGENYQKIASDNSLLNADLQVLGMQLTAALNKMKLGDIDFQEI